MNRPPQNRPGYKRKPPIAPPPRTKRAPEPHAECAHTLRLRAALKAICNIAPCRQTFCHGCPFNPTAAPDAPSSAPETHAARKRSRAEQKTTTPSERPSS